MKDDFVHLHVHSMGSVLDGLPTPEEIARRAAELGQNSISLTDHGSMAAAFRFGKACEDVGVKPLFGIEGYLCEDISVKEKDDPIYHFIVLALNNAGLQKLYKISNVSWNQGFYKKPRIDFNSFESIWEGADSDLAVLSGCMQGAISKSLERNDSLRLGVWLDRFRKKFNNFYIEVQPWNSSDLNTALLDVADTHGLPVVATADTHYCEPSEKIAEEVNLLISQTTGMKEAKKEAIYTLAKTLKNKSIMEKLNILHPDRKLRFDDLDNYIMSKEEIRDKMRAVGIDRDDLYDNTVLLADKVDISVPKHGDYFPKFHKRINSREYLKEMAFDKLAELGLDTKEYRDRLNDELLVITELGFTDYFLILWDAIHWAKTKDIMVGPGRGSVGGSLLAFVLGITQVNPIKHNLTFWRFLQTEIDYDGYKLVEK